MNRVCIIGGSGTGKTTLANNLGKDLNLPIYHIDGIHHLKRKEIKLFQKRLMRKNGLWMVHIIQP